MRWLLLLLVALVDPTVGLYLAAAVLTVWALRIATRGLRALRP